MSKFVLICGPQAVGKINNTNISVEEVAKIIKESFNL